MNVQTHRDHRRQQGFTLIEIMVVIVLLGILVTMAAKNVIGIFGDSQQQLAQTQVKSLVEDVNTYRIKYGRMPTSLDELATKDEKGFAVLAEVPKDPWGSDYVLRGGDRGSDFEIVSPGPDRSEGGDDDITSKPKKDQ